MPLIFFKELQLFNNHGSYIIHSVIYSACFTLPVSHSPTIPFFFRSTHCIRVCLAVCTMEVPTKWSRASVISFIKGLGKSAWGKRSCACMFSLHACSDFTQTSHPGRGVYVHPTSPVRSGQVVNKGHRTKLGCLLTHTSPSAKALGVVVCLNIRIQTCMFASVTQTSFVDFWFLL